MKPIFSSINCNVLNIILKYGVKLICTWCYFFCHSWDYIVLYWTSQKFLKNRLLIPLPNISELYFWPDLVWGKVPWRTGLDLVHMGDSWWVLGCLFHWLGPLGRVSHRVAMSVCVFLTLQNTHFRVLWRPLVKERIPNIGLWWHNFQKKGGSGIGASIRIGREDQCFLYAGLF